MGVGLPLDRETDVGVLFYSEIIVIPMQHAPSYKTVGSLATLLQRNPAVPELAFRFGADRRCGLRLSTSRGAEPKPSHPHVNRAHALQAANGSCFIS